MGCNPPGKPHVPFHEGLRRRFYGVTSVSFSDAKGEGRRQSSTMGSVMFQDLLSTGYNYE